MRILYSFFGLICFFLLVAWDENETEYFTSSSLRIDYVLTADADTLYAGLYKLKKEPFWGGSYTRTIDAFNYGSYMVRVFDSASDVLIYSRGFSSIVEEWQITSEAIERPVSFSQSVNVPYPVQTVWVELIQRRGGNEGIQLLGFFVNPDDWSISPENQSFSVQEIRVEGRPEEKVDIVVLAEGYTVEQEQKFYDDTEKLFQSLFSQSPFDEFRSCFNVRAVFSASAEEGVDLPGQGVWRATSLNASFYTFGIERYLTSLDYFRIKDVAASVPYDQIVILVNTSLYGGGGIFNYYMLTVSDNQMAHEILAHEFAHSFAGLADEYYVTDESFLNFYSIDQESWEPNITTLVDFSNKWRAMISDSVPVPTPDTDAYQGVVGVYEGAGYREKGVYRPFPDCRMRSNQAPGFCPVCMDAIERMVRFYCPMP